MMSRGRSAILISFESRSYVALLSGLPADEQTFTTTTSSSHARVCRRTAFGRWDDQTAMALRGSRTPGSV
jgi:hypothetical protein